MKAGCSVADTRLLLSLSAVALGVGGYVALTCAVIEGTLGYGPRYGNLAAGACLAGMVLGVFLLTTA